MAESAVAQMEYATTGLLGGSHPLMLERVDPDSIPDLVRRLKVVEASVRDFRLHLDAQINGRRCLMCGKPIAGRADRVLCSPLCRKRFNRGASPLEP